LRSLPNQRYFRKKNVRTFSSEEIPIVDLASISNAVMKVIKIVALLFYVKLLINGNDNSLSADVDRALENT